MDAQTWKTLSLSFKLGFTSGQIRHTSAILLYKQRKQADKVNLCRRQSKLPPLCSPVQRVGQVGGAGEGGVVIAVCRWRVCGSCWLWTRLYVRGWMRSWSVDLVWASVLPVLSRSNKPASPGHGSAPLRTLPPDPPPLLHLPPLPPDL